MKFKWKYSKASTSKYRNSASNLQMKFWMKKPFNIYAQVKCWNSNYANSTINRFRLIGPSQYYTYTDTLIIIHSIRLLAMHSSIALLLERWMRPRQLASSLHFLAMQLHLCCPVQCKYIFQVNNKLPPQPLFVHLSTITIVCNFKLTAVNSNCPSIGNRDFLHIPHPYIFLLSISLSPSINSLPTILPI